MIVQASALHPINRERQGEITVAISLTEDIKTVEDLVNDPRALLEQAQRNGRPVVIAEGGKPAVVMLKAERYEWLVHLLNLNKLLNEGVEDVLAGRVKPAEQVFNELGIGKKKKKVSR